MLSLEAPDSFGTFDDPHRYENGLRLYRSMPMGDPSDGQLADQAEQMALLARGTYELLRSNPPGSGLI